MGCQSSALPGDHNSTMQDTGKDRRDAEVAALPEIVALDTPAVVDRALVDDRSELEASCLTLLDIAKENEPAITALLAEKAKQLGGKLEGLDFRLKHPRSLVRKALADFTEARQKAVQVEGALAKPVSVDETVFAISDVLRYTFTFDDDTYSASAEDCMKAIHGAGFNLVKAKNFWLLNETYRGINTVYGCACSPTIQGRRPNVRFQFEVQFHTPASFAVKQSSHKFYEEYRTERDPERKALVYLESIKAAGTAIPPGVAKIPKTATNPAPENVKMHSLVLQATLNSVHVGLAVLVEECIGAQYLTRFATCWQCGTMPGATGEDCLMCQEHLQATPSEMPNAARLERKIQRALKSTDSVEAADHPSALRSRLQAACGGVTGPEYSAVFPEDEYITLATGSLAKLQAQGMRKLPGATDSRLDDGSALEKGYHAQFESSAGGVVFAVHMFTKPAFEAGKAAVESVFSVETSVFNTNRRPAVRPATAPATALSR